MKKLIYVALAAVALPLGAAELSLQEPTQEWKQSITARLGQVDTMPVSLPAVPASLRPDYRRARLTGPRSTDSAAVADVLKAGLRAVREQSPTAVLRAAAQAKATSLRDHTAGEAQVEFDSSGSIATLVQGEKLGGGLLAADFLDTYGALFGLRDPRAELKLGREWSDALGQHHYRYQQYAAGYPVWARELSVHTDRDNQVTRVFAQTIPSPRLSASVPLIAQSWAEAAATNSIGRAVSTIGTELLVYPRPYFGSKLAYQVSVADAGFKSWQVFVDAVDGSVIHAVALHREAGATASASGQDLMGNSRTFTAWLENGTYYMLDPTKPLDQGGETPVQNQRSVGDLYVYNCHNTSGCSNQTFVTSSAPNSGWDATAVSGYLNVIAAYNYYLSTFNRHSIDGSNGSLRGVVHFGQNIDQASWGGGYMVFGDGGTVFNPLARCLDVAGHEMTHGVVEATANLIYEYQPGALNESIADTFGAMVDRSNWTLGENCTKVSPFFLRSMRHPGTGLSSQPENMSQYQAMSSSQDYGGVHTNSGIPNRAAYLIAEGLTAEGLGTSIGRSQAEQLYYRALTTYLLRNSQFIDLRRAMLSSAADLYPGNATVTSAITTAFNFVGIVEDNSTATNSSPTSASVLSGIDVASYLVPVDGIFDTDEAATGFNLYVQFMAQPYTGYDPNQAFGPLNTAVASSTRPALFFSNNNPYVLYVSTNYQLMVVLPDGSNTALTGPNTVFSIAANRDGALVAYTSPNADDNNIYLVNVSANTTTPYPITVQNYQEGSVASATKISFADYLAFNYLDDKILFDAKACTSTATSTCSSGGGATYWTIGTLKSDGSIQFPFLGANDFDIGNPVPAYNNDSIIAFDLLDYSDPNTFFAGTVIYDTDKTQVVYAGTRYQTTYPATDSARLFGVPGFWGDDNGLAVQVYNSAAGRHISLDRFPLNSDFTIASSPSAVEMHPQDAAFVRLYRTGTRAAGVLTPSASAVNFGDVLVGASKTLTVTLSNASGSDVTIQGIVSSSNRYSHNGSQTIVPRGQAVTVRITFAPATAGSSSGTLTFTTNQAQNLVVNLSGTGTTPPAPSGGGGGGGGIPLSTLLGLLVARGLRRPIKQARG